MVNVYLQYESGKPIPLRDIDHLELITLRRDLRAAWRESSAYEGEGDGGDLGLALDAVEAECDRRFDEATAAYRARRQPNGDPPPTPERLMRKTVGKITAKKMRLFDSVRESGRNTPITKYQLDRAMAKFSKLLKARLPNEARVQEWEVSTTHVRNVGDINGVILKAVADVPAQQILDELLDEMLVSTHGFR